MAPRQEYLQPDQFDSPPPPFRTGAAGLVDLGHTGEFDLEERVRISANSLHGMLGHGLHHQLNALALEGSVGDGLPVLIRPALVEASRSVLYAADPLTYGCEWDFVAHREDGAEGEAPTEYRVAVANRELQITLVRIIDVLNRASRYGQAAFIRL